MRARLRRSRERSAMSPEAFLPVALLLGYLLGSIPFGLILTKTRRHAGSALDRLRQYRRHQRAAHRPQGPRRGDADLRHAQGHGRGGDRRLLRRTERRDAGGARRLSRPSVSGLAQIQGRQRRRGLYRRADRTVLAGGGGVLRDVARDRRHLALLVALGAGRELSSRRSSCGGSATPRWPRCSPC